MPKICAGMQYFQMSAVPTSSAAAVRPHGPPHGTMFITPGTPVYAGMIVGCSPKAEDIVVNVCKKKHVTNMRASGSDEALRLTPPRIFSLEECLEFIGDDELVEVTPKSLRLRKRILDHTMRMRAQYNKKNQQ